MSRLRCRDFFCDGWMVAVAAWQGCGGLGVLGEGEAASGMFGRCW